MAIEATESASTAATGDAYERYEAIFGDLEPPFAFCDLDAVWSNAAEMLGRAGGKPIRVASKSVRCRDLLAPHPRARPRLSRPADLHAARGLLARRRRASRTSSVAYPTADRTRAGRARAADRGRARPRRRCVMVDSVAHLDLIEAATGRRRRARSVRVCIELDVGWWPLGGPDQDRAEALPVRTPEQARELAQEIERRAGVAPGRADGLRGPHRGRRRRGAGTAAARTSRSGDAAALGARAARKRRAAVVAAVREVAELEFVNGGGTGSIAATAAEPAVTEVAAGSGFYAPVLFDHYSSLRAASGRGLRARRRPQAVAADRDRARRRLRRLRRRRAATASPSPTCRAGCGSTRSRAPARSRRRCSASPRRALEVGDRVYFRHAKAGELCERFNSLHLVEGGRDRRRGARPTAARAGRFSRSLSAGAALRTGPSTRSVYAFEKRPSGSSRARTRWKSSQRG